jgi:hypothetical protein
VRSLVGLLPLCAATVFEPEVVERYPMFTERIAEFVRDFSDAVPALAHLPGPSPEGRRIVSLVDEHRLRRILSIMLDEGEFLGPHGIRAISRRHLEQPCVFEWGGQEYRVRYLPAESDTGMFGGNSNWRGPVWFPMNLVILRGLIQLHRYYGERLKVECPTGSGREMTLLEVGTEIGTRLAMTFTEDENGCRPVFGGIEKFQTDPHWHDLLQFHEYFHGDDGAGIGASHQTGWTGTVALLFLLAGALHVGPGARAARAVTDSRIPGQPAAGVCAGGRVGCVSVGTLSIAGRSSPGCARTSGRSGGRAICGEVTREWNARLAAETRERSVRYRAYVAALADEKPAAARREHMLQTG